MKKFLEVTKITKKIKKMSVEDGSPWGEWDSNELF